MVVTSLPLILALFAADPAPPGTPTLAPSLDGPALLRRGTELYKAGVYDKAAQAFEAAWKLAPTPTTALNLAQSYEGAGQPAEALLWYGRVLESEPAGPRQAAALSGRRHLQTHAYLAVTCGPPGARLEVAGNVGACPTFGVYLPAGPQTVSLTAEGRAPHSESVTLMAGGRKVLTLELARAVTVAPAPPSSASSLGPAVAESAVVPVTSDDPPAPAERAVPAWVGYTLLGVGAAGLVLGGVFYGRAQDDADEASALSNGDRRDELESEFQTDQTVAYTGMGAGVAFLLGGGATLIFGGGF